MATCDPMYGKSEDVLQLEGPSQEILKGGQF